MSDLGVPLQERVRAQLVIKGTRERLYWVALKITGSAANAGDLVQDAMVEVLRSEGSPWEKWTFLTHMTFVMRRVWDQQQRAHTVKNEMPDEDVTRGTKGLSREAPA